LQEDEEPSHFLSSIEAKAHKPNASHRYGAELTKDEKDQEWHIKCHMQNYCYLINKYLSAFTYDNKML
jgi:hypothetical protein